MIRFIVIAAGTAIVLGGCADGAADFGTRPPLALVTARQESTVPLGASGPSKRRLLHDIDSIAQGNLQAVRAHIVAPSNVQMKEARETLVGIGLDPAHITASISSSRPTSTTTVVLFRTTTRPNNCAAAIALAFPDDPTYSLLNLSHCVQDNNLAAMVVDPADLVAPSRLGPTDGAYLAGGVQSWRGSRRTQLPAASGGLNSSVGASGASASPTTMPVSSSPSPITQSP
jgi:type IV pilus biogenesis protein CpaD/CtpE